MRAHFFTGFISCCIAVGITLAVLYTQFYDKNDVDSRVESSYSGANLYREFQNKCWIFRPRLHLVGVCLLLLY